jgi:hypothetical protein
VKYRGEYLGLKILEYKELHNFLSKVVVDINRKCRKYILTLSRNLKGKFI